MATLGFYSLKFHFFCVAIPGKVGAWSASSGDGEVPRLARYIIWNQSVSVMSVRLSCPNWGQGGEQLTLSKEWPWFHAPAFTFEWGFHVGLQVGFCGPQMSFFNSEILYVYYFTFTYWEIAFIDYPMIWALAKYLIPLFNFLLLEWG